MRHYYNIMKTIIINQNDSGQRVDKFLTKLLPQMPKSLLYKSFRKKRIKLGKKALSPQDILTCGDELCLYINDEFFGEKKTVTSDGSGLLVVYEDENILVCEKPAGQKAHGDEVSLLSQIQGYLYKKGEYLPEQENSFRIALSNRIDRNTKGLVLAAKNAAAQRLLNEKIKNGEVEKEYLCVVCGKMPKKKDVLRHFLLISDRENRVRIVPEGTKGAKEALLEYEVLREKGDKSLLRVRLITGRKHQIRVQLSAIGHPLLGDTKYGAKKDSTYRYQALCAYRLTFCFQGDSGILESLKGKVVSLSENQFEELF